MNVDAITAGPHWWWVLILGALVFIVVIIVWGMLKLLRVCIVNNIYCQLD